MSVIVNFNGNNYTVPVTGDFNWGNYTTTLLVALANAVFPKAGGNFFLTGDVNFGTAFGLIAKYFTSASLNPSQSGVVRLANTDVIGWRNAGNNGDDILGVNSSDQLIFNGVTVGGGGGGVTSGNISIHGNTTGQSSASNYALSGLNVSAVGLISAGWSSNTLILSAPNTTNFANLSVSAGTTSGSLGSLIFSNSNNVSFGLNGSVITASAAGGGSGGVALYDGANSISSGTARFSGVNMTFSINGQTVSGIVPATSSIVGAGGITVSSAGNTITISGNNGAITGGVSLYGNTTGQSSNSTYSLSGLNVSGAGLVSVGWSSNTLIFSGPGTTNFANLSVSAGTASGSLGSIVFSNSNNVSFGLNGSTITASVAGGAGAVNFSAGTTSGNLSSVIFSNSNGVSFGMNGSTITGSVPATSSIVGVGGITVSSAGNTISISGNGAGAPLSLGVSTGGNTSGNTGAYSGQAIFVGGNNITLSVGTAAGGAQTITISGANAGGAQTGISGVVVSNTTYSSGTISFVNSNGISFGSSGANGISASYTVPSTAGLISRINVSAGTTSNNLSAITFSNSNGVSFGLNGSVITASAAGGGAQSIGVSTGGNTAGNTGIYSGQAVFAGGNNITLSVGTAAGQAQTISIAAPATSSIVGTGAVSVSVNASTISIGAPVLSLGVSTGGNTSGNTGAYSGQAIFVGGNNITLSVGTGAGGAQTITISGANAGGAQTGISGFQVSNTTYSSGTITFQNANGISFGSSGANGISASYTVPTQSVQPVAISGSNGSFAFSTLTMGNLNGISHYTSNGSLVASYTVPTQTTPTGTTFNGVNLSGSITLNSNGINLSLSGPTESGVGISANGSSQTIGNIIFSNSNGISFGMSGSTVTASAAGGGGNVVNFSAGTTSGNLASVIFSNSNGVSFGLNGSVITASAAGGGGGGGINFGVSTGGNTAGATGTVSTGNVILVGGSNISLSQATGGAGSNATITINAPAQSSLVGTNGLNISSSASTISVYPIAKSRLIYPYDNLTQISAAGNATLSIQYVPVDWPVTATRLDALVAWSAASTVSANTCAIAMSMYAAIYTLNGSTLSSVSSGSTQTTYSYASNTAGVSLGGTAIRPLSVPVNMMITPGEYYVGFNFITATSSIGTATTNYGQTFSMIGGNQLLATPNYAEIGSATAATNNLFQGMGLYTAATTGIPSSIPLAAINGTSTNLVRANIAIVFRNY